jgi:hypothetical protein
VDGVMCGFSHCSLCIVKSTTLLYYVPTMWLWLKKVYCNYQQPFYTL